MLLCLLTNTATAETNTLSRDYRMVNLDNGVTSTLLEVGTTSVTFAVDWLLESPVPEKLMLLGKRDMEDEWWSFLGEVEVLQKQGKKHRRISVCSASRHGDGL